MSQMMMVPKNVPTETGPGGKPGTSVYNVGGLPDAEGKNFNNSVFGELITTARRDDVSIQFQYNIANADANTQVTGTGALIERVPAATAGVTPGAGVGLAEIESKQAVRYRPGHEFHTMFTAFFENPEAGVDSKIGLLNSTDGMAVGFQGADFGAWFIEGGNINHYSGSQLLDPLDGNGPSGITIATNKMNIFKISGGWLGIAPLVYSIFDFNRMTWSPFFIYNGVNVDAEPHLNNPTLPMRAIIERTSGSGASSTIKTSSWRAGVAATVETEEGSDRLQVFETSKSITGGVLTPIISWRSKTTLTADMGSLTNHVRSKLGTFTASTDGTKSVRWRLFIDGSLTGDVFADVDSHDSVLEVDTTATAITGGTLVGGTIMGKVDSQRINLLAGDVPITILAGQTLTIAAISTNASDIELFTRTKEEF